MDFPGGSVVKNPPAMQERRVQSLGQEDLLEEEMATHSRILAWKSHGQRSLARATYSPWGRKRVSYNLATKQQQKMKSLDAGIIHTAANITKQEKTRH